MHCFCLTYLNENGSIEGSRAEFLKIAPDFGDDPCRDWLNVYQNSFVLLLMTGLIITGVNWVVVAIF